MAELFLTLDTPHNSLDEVLVPENMKVVTDEDDAVEGTVKIHRPSGTPTIDVIGLITGGYFEPERGTPSEVYPEDGPPQYEMDGDPDADEAWFEFSDGRGELVYCENGHLKGRESGLVDEELLETVFPDVYAALDELIGPFIFDNVQAK